MGEKRESCNSRHLSRLMKSCFPNPTTTTTPDPLNPIIKHRKTTTTTTATSATISTLPDDILAEILSRVPLSSLPSLSSVCRRWSRLLDCPSFSILRRSLRLLHPTLFAFSVSSSSTLATLRLGRDEDNQWRIQKFNHGSVHGEDISWYQNDDVLFSVSHIDFSHSRLVPLGRKIYFIGRSGCAVFDPWTASLCPISPPLFPRKRFAAASVAGKIYAAGGSTGATAVEEYDPESDEWRVVSHAPRRRYGCVGVGVDGVFYVVGGLKIGGGGSACNSRAAYASSMDLYDVAGGGWLRTRAVPGGGCVVAACGAQGNVYVLASHAVELSFWLFNARRSGGGGKGGVSGGGGFGEWRRMKGPPIPGQVRVDGTVRFRCVGVQDKVVLIQVVGCIDDLLRRSGRNARGCRDGLVLVFDCVTEEWSRGPDLPELVQRAACVCVEC